MLSCQPYLQGLSNYTIKISFKLIDNMLKARGDYN